MRKWTPGAIPFKSTHDLKCTKIDAKEKVGVNLLKSPLFDDREKSFTKKKANFPVKDTDQIEIPRILTRQKNLIIERQNTQRRRRSARDALKEAHCNRRSARRAAQDAQ